MTAGVPGWWMREGAASGALLPISWLFRGIAGVRRKLYRSGWRRQHRPGVPVIVIGNIFVGGTGKTPVVLHTVEVLHSLGYRPAVLTRGYGGRVGRGPHRIESGDPPEEVGDEPALIHALANCPVFVGSDRARSAAAAEAHGADVLVCDDGLQHYALARDVEIVVVDAARGLGNGRVLPAGPLREPPGRLGEVDAVVANGGPYPGADWHFALQAAPPRSILQFRDAAAEVNATVSPVDGPVHAVTGIGHPARFFGMLEALGYTIVRHPYPDHHAFRPEDLEFPDNQPILMTGKDAVKCARFPQASQCWWIPVKVAFAGDGESGFRALLVRRLGEGRENHQLHE